MTQEQIEFIKKALEHCARLYKDDSLERAEAAFRNLSDKRLDKKYGESGRTCREILEGYRNGRREWREAKEAFEGLVREMEVEVGD